MPQHVIEMHVMMMYILIWKTITFDTYNEDWYKDYVNRQLNERQRDITAVKIIGYSKYGAGGVTKKNLWKVTGKKSKKKKIY